MIKIRKKVKVVSEAQKRARERNWNKAQIMCIQSIAHKLYSAETTHENEKADLGIIIDASCSIIQNWNK